MSASALTPSASDDLQFETVESRDVNVAATGTSRKCVGCGQPIVSTYFAVGDKVVCPTCCSRINAPVAGSQLWAFAKATLLGLGAGLLGAAIWFAIRRGAHMELGIVAILLGFMVGKAVRNGSGNRGGIGCQVLAVLITYCCIAANYMPDSLEVAIRSAPEHQRIAAPMAVVMRTRPRQETSLLPAKQPTLTGLRLEELERVRLRSTPRVSVGLLKWH